MNFLTLDTETINIEKAFTYNIGWVIRSTNGDILTQKDYIVKQVWENKPLFETAFYALKKQLYIGDLRSRKSKIKHYGFIMLDLLKDLERYDIKYCYAFNSPFDTKVINFNCEWYKCTNPLDYIGELLDIRALINNIIFSPEYKKFCVDNKLITTNGNLSVNAETVYKFVTGNAEFVERHTALADSLIESDILLYLVNNGVDITSPKKVYNTIRSDLPQKYMINYKGKLYTFTFVSKRTIKGVIHLE